MMQQKAILEEISIPRPQDHHQLVGHEAVASMLERAAQKGQLPHGWLFTGPKGIGKATLAYRFARMMLCGQSTMHVDQNSATVRKISSSTHPDMLVLERKINEKTAAQEADIKIESVRQVNEFLAYTSSSGSYRIVLVDSVDDLNLNAANALLKNLEEPPARTLFLLINHRPEAILPTIASRCITLRMHRLSQAQVGEVLAYILPDITADYLEKLTSYAGGCPGIAAALSNSSWEKWLDSLVLLLQAWPKLNMNKVHEWIDSILRSQADDNFMLALYVLYILFSRGIRHSLTPTKIKALPQEEALWNNTLWTTKSEILLHLIQQLGGMATNRKLIHAEKRSTLIKLFEQLRPL